MVWLESAGSIIPTAFGVKKSCGLPPLRRPKPKPKNWLRQRASNENLYHDGAYRLYAPRIDYDRVLAEARSARARQDSLSTLLAKWSKEYALGDDLKPITSVLREAGYVI